MDSHGNEKKHGMGEEGCNIIVQNQCQFGQIHWGKVELFLVLMLVDGTSAVLFASSLATLLLCGSVRKSGLTSLF